MMAFAIGTAAMAYTALGTLRSITGNVMEILNNDEKDSAVNKAKEIIKDKAINFVVDKAAAKVVDKVDGMLNIDKDIAKLQKTLGMIQGIVQEAEKKEIDNVFIQNWLSDLVDISLEARDVLEDFIAYSSCIRVEPSSRLVNFIPSRISFLLSYFGGLSNDTSELPLTVLNRLEKDIRGVRERFDEKKKEGKTFATLKSVVGGGSESVPTNNTRPEVGPYLNRQGDNLFLGREEVKEGIMEKILHPSDNRVHVVPIWGMGGIGKTTLAQSIYNDERVNEEDYPSKNRLWHSVGEDKFSAEKVIKEIISDSNTSGIGKLQEKLVEKLKGDRFLIVLDDVWDVDGSGWNLLFNPLTHVGKGGFIIITTRKSEVITATNTLVPDTLRPLSYQHSWSIFESHAFISGNSDNRPDLKCVGEKIVEKLKGLPLALEVVGCSLLNEDASTWENFLNSKDDDVMSALRWSYNLLRPHLKYCFAYCALFPKDHVFEEKVLVEMWMAHDLIPTEMKKRPEDVGIQCFKQLLSASLLQFVDGKYVMHDMIHDLAVLVSNGEFASTSSSLSNDHMEKVRHITIIGDYPENLRLCKTKRILTLYTIRRLLLVASNRTCFSIDVLDDLKSTSIRVLVLSNIEITEIPDCIGELRHLRYLDVSRTRVKSLPDSLCHLYHLQVLVVPHHAELPRDIVNMVNLRYLRANLPTCKGIGKLTSLQELSSICVCKDDNIRELGDMQLLREKLTIKGLGNVTSSEDAAGASMKKQTHIDQLRLLFSKENPGSDRLRFLLFPKENSRYTTIFEENLDMETDTTVFEENSDMETDTTISKENSDTDTDTTISEKVLNSLECPPNLTYLQIDGYNGLKPPRWMVVGQIVDKLQTLKLSNCPKLDSLPPLGELNFLKDLSLRYLHGVKRLGDEFYGNLTKRDVFFPSLGSLSFHYMKKWTEWDDITINNSSVSFFPRLTSLEIVQCPKLVLVLPTIKTLKRKDKHPTMSAANFMESLSRLQISYCNRLKRLQLDALLSLKDLDIDFCSSLVRITSSRCLASTVERLRIFFCEHLETMDFESLPSLKRLDIRCCNKLISIPRLQGGIKYFYLHICKSLKALTFNIIDGLDSLEDLKIHKCPVLELAYEEGSISSSYSSGKSVAARLCISIDKKQIFRKLFEHKFVSLETLIIKSVTEFENFSEIEENNFYELKSLKILRISFFSDLQSLPANIHKLSSLNTLKIDNCPKLQSLPRDLHKLSSLIRLKIAHCSQLQSLPPDFHKLSSLKRLEILSCRQLQPLPLDFHKLSSLNRLHIAYCPQLQSLPENFHKLSSLESLYIHCCSQFQSLPLNFHELSSFNRLHIAYCPQLQSLPENFHKLSSLEKLHIISCERLQSLPAVGLPRSIESLKIYNCPLLWERCKNESSPDWHKIKHIHEIKLYCSAPYNHIKYKDGVEVSFDYENDFEEEDYDDL